MAGDGNPSLWEWAICVVSRENIAHPLNIMRSTVTPTFQSQGIVSKHYLTRLCTILILTHNDKAATPHGVASWGTQKNQEVLPSVTSTPQTRDATWGAYMSELEWPWHINGRPSLGLPGITMARALWRPLALWRGSYIVKDGYCFRGLVLERRHFMALI